MKNQPTLIDKKEPVRVRMAPSPTGPLHIGTARTALFNYLFAKKYNGTFILRLEDTDRERSEEKWEDNIINGLSWLGISWDEGLQIVNRKSQVVKNSKGKYGPYRQSERGEIYEKYIQSLLDEKKAFYCWHTQEELQKEQVEQNAQKQAPRHKCQYRDKGMENDEKRKVTSIIRFKNDGEGKISFFDFIRGTIEFEAQLLGDFSIAKNLHTPLYNFAVVIDDWEMNISHVIRGEDHISNTPKQILLQKALGFRTPKYIHAALILGSDKSKLSKRHGATSLSEYADIGYLPRAMFNFLALLGWRPSHDKEIMDAEEIIEEFSVENMQQAGAIFDIDKLNWMNGEYIRALPISKLTELTKPYFKKAGFETNDTTIEKIVALEHGRIKKLSDIIEATEFIFKDIRYEEELLVWKKMDPHELKHVLPRLEKIIEGINEKKWTKEEIEKIIMPEAEKVGDRGSMLWPLRVALTGRKASPGPFEVMEVLGKQKSLKRVQEAIEMLNVG